LAGNPIPRRKQKKNNQLIFEDLELEHEEEKHLLIPLPSEREDEKTKVPYVEITVFRAGLDTFGDNDFFAPRKDHKLDRVKKYVDDKHEEAFSRQDIDQFMEWHISHSDIHDLLTSQLVHQIWWQYELSRYVILTDLPVTASSLEKGRKDMLRTLRRQYRDIVEHTDWVSPDSKIPDDKELVQWFMTFTPPFGSRDTWSIFRHGIIRLPSWFLDKYHEATQLCNSKYKTDYPIVRATRSALDDIFDKDYDHGRDSSKYVIVCLHNGQYAGHIYAWLGSLYKSFKMSGVTEINETVVIAQGIRSSLWNNTLGTCGISPAGVAKQLIEGVRRFALEHNCRYMAIDYALPSMMKVLQQAGFSEGGGTSSIQHSVRRTDTPITEIDSFFLFDDSLHNQETAENI